MFRQWFPAGCGWKMFASTKRINLYVLGLSLAALLVAAGCGGGGSSSTSTPGNNSIVNPSTANNVVPIVVSGGPTSTPQTNLAYVSVTVCVPGSTTNCQTIDNIQVDTGSEGLRILSSVLTAALPQETDLSGNPLAECAQFQDGYTWGPMNLADVKLGGESAGSVPVQVIGGGGAALSAVPSSCANTGTAENTVDALGANGILGIGPFRQDCGSSCASTDLTLNPGFYYSCPSSGCVQAPATLAQQAQNPVWMFPTDNNGTIVELPAIPASGAPTVNGSLVFGIGTQSNNGLGNATVFTLDNSGNFTTTFKSAAYNLSFLDSGSNGIFFLDSSLTGIPECTGANAGFYCPSSIQNLSATDQGLNGTAAAVAFSITSAASLTATSNAFNNLGGPFSTSSNTGFDWGLPFFFGRNVYTGIEGQNTPGGAGPLFAF